MKLALNNMAHYPDLADGYNLYVKRSKGGRVFDRKMYARIVKMYCAILANRLLETGVVDLPKGLGTISAARLTRKPQYRGKTFVGYGKMDWTTGQYDGKLKTFGIVYLPKHGKNNNLRSLGFVANRSLFKRMKSLYESCDCKWGLLDFNDEMI